MAAIAIAGCDPPYSPVTLASMFVRPRRRSPATGNWSLALNSGSEMPILIATHCVNQKEPAVSYMVLYTGLDGSAAFERCEELTEAVAEVERLRNEQSIEDARIYRLEEVKFEIKPYFRVELPGRRQRPRRHRQQ